MYPFPPYCVHGACVASSEAADAAAASLATAMYHTGWQRLIGCLKLQVIFRKRSTNYRALLRKMTCEDPMGLRHPVRDISYIKCISRTLYILYML